PLQSDGIRWRRNHTSAFWETRHRRFEDTCRGQISYTRNRGGVSVWRNLILAAGLFACLIPAGTLAQEDRKTVTVEVYLPEGARLFIEGQDRSFRGPMRRFVSPPLPPGKYTYTIKAIIPGPNGPRTVTRRLEVRPGDFESIDLRASGKRPITDVECEPTPQKLVGALLR